MAKLNDKDIRSAKTLMATLECFKELRATMPMQYVLTFLLIATDEGKPVGEYAVKAGVSPSVMSRHVLDIGIRQRGGDGEGFNLVETKPNYNNLREHNVFLTDKGRGLLHRIVRTLEK